MKLFAIIYTVNMNMQSYSPRSEYGGHSTVVTKPVTAGVSLVSVLALVGLLVAVALLVAKLVKRYSTSNEKRPLLRDRSVHTSVL